MGQLLKNALLGYHCSGLLVSEVPFVSPSKPPGGSGTNTWSSHSVFSCQLFYQPHFLLLKENTFFRLLWKKLFWIYFWIRAVLFYAVPLILASCQPQYFLLTFHSLVSQYGHLYRSQENIKVSRHVGYRKEPILC